MLKILDKAPLKVVAMSHHNKYATETATHRLGYFQAPDLKGAKIHGPCLEVRIHKWRGSATVSGWTFDVLSTFIDSCLKLSTAAASQTRCSMTASRELVYVA
jgi:hypothetical protein